MISDVSFPRVNGVSTSIATFRSSLAELGHETTLIAPSYPGLGMREDELRISSRAVPLDPEDRLMSYREAMALTGRLAAERFDIIHVHTPFVAHYAGVTLGRRLGLPVVETYHTFFEEYLHHYIPLLPSSLTRWAARRFTVSQCRSVDALVVPSRQMLGVLRDYGIACRAEVIPTGLDLSKFQGGDGHLFRREHGIHPDRPVLAHISRVAHEKNIDFILRTLVEVRRKVPDVLLVLAGEGPALPYLKKLTLDLELVDNVRFIGYLDRATTLLDCYRAANAFVFASRTETQGLVLLEALALGVPVVSTAVMGTADVLRDVKGAVVAPDHLEGFADAVVSVVLDADRQRELSVAGPKDAEAWSAYAMAGSLAGLYREVIESKSR